MDKEASDSPSLKSSQMFLINCATSTSSQHRQTHLRMDRALKVDLKKKVRHIKPIERKAALESSRKSNVILQYCQTLRYALQEDGDYPLKPGGLSFIVDSESKAINTTKQ